MQVIRGKHNTSSTHGGQGCGALRAPAGRHAQLHCRLVHRSEVVCVAHHDLMKGGLNFCPRIPLIFNNSYRS